MLLPLFPFKLVSTRTPIELVLIDDIGYRDQISFNVWCWRLFHRIYAL